MSVTITQKPFQTISSEDSKWSASGNPVVYKFQRSDYTFNQVNNNGGFVQLQINGADYTADFTNGGLLYVKATNNEYDTVCTQTAEAFSGGNTLITTDIPYTGVAPGGFVNIDDLKPLYRVYIEVYRYLGVDYDDSNNELLGTFNFSPTSTGYTVVDIAATLQANMSPDIDLDAE